MTGTLKILSKLIQNNSLQTAFITQAILDYAQKVVINEEMLRKDSANGFISADAWLECAKDCLKEFKS